MRWIRLTATEQAQLAQLFKTTPARRLRDEYRRLQGQAADNPNEAMTMASALVARYFQPLGVAHAG